MKLGQVKLLLAGALVAFLAGCGSDSGGVSKTSKKIGGVALKADGSAFSTAATVLAVDQNGNVAEGSVDANGNYTVTLTGVASSGKKAKLVEGNSFIRITEGSSTIDLVIGEEQTKVNANAITSAASLLALGDDADLDAIFDEVEDANASTKSEKAVTNASILAALAKVKVLTEKLFKENASAVAGSLFGFGEDGADVIDVDKLINGSAKEKEVTMIKAAAAVSGNIITAAVNAANNPNSSDFLLNSPEFFEALAGEIAGAEGTASATAFSSFLNSVIQDSAVKTALAEIKDALNELVTALESDPEATLDVEIPETVQAAPSVTVSVDRDGDTISYEVTDGAIGDTTVASLAILSGSDVKAVVSVPLVFDGTKLVPSTATITVVTDSVSVTVKNSAAVTDGEVDLAVALEEAKTALTNASQTDLADSVPASSVGYTLVISGTPVTRTGVKAVNTFIEANGATVNSLSGITLE